MLKDKTRWRNFIDKEFGLDELDQNGERILVKDMSNILADETYDSLMETLDENQRVQLNTMIESNTIESDIRAYLHRIAPDYGGGLVRFKNYMHEQVYGQG